MTLHPTTAILLDRERRRDLEHLAAPARDPVSRRLRRVRLALRRTVPALTRTT
jgi:hypothetical protein